MGLREGFVSNLLDQFEVKGIDLVWKPHKFGASNVPCQRQKASIAGNGAGKLWVKLRMFSEAIHLSPSLACSS